MRAVRCLGWLVVVAAGMLRGGGTVRGDDAHEFEYVRDASNAHAIVKSIRTRAADEPVLFVFDAATFDPPPGRNEFKADYDFRSGGAGGVMGWFMAIHDVWTGAPQRPFVATSISDDVRRKQYRWRPCRSRETNGVSPA